MPRANATQAGLSCETAPSSEVCWPSCRWRSALNALLAEVGMARSLLAYEDLLTGLTLIDGHLRREQLNEDEVTVEVLDVTPEEAEKLLLSMDPLGALADFEADRLTQLQGRVHSDSDVLNTLWANVGKASRKVEQLLRTKATERPPVGQALPENYPHRHRVRRRGRRV